MRADGVRSLLVSQARRFAQNEIDGSAIDARGAIGPALLRRAAELGLFAVTVPEAHGGLGLGLGDACALVEELARHDRSIAVTVGLHLGLGTRALVESGNETLKARFLPSIAAGERIASFCATEPAAGSDLTRLETSAVFERGALRLHGEKSYVTNGGFAGCFTVLARTPGLGGRAATSLLFLPRESPGLSIGREEHKLGLRGSSTVSVRFDGVRVPVDAVLGPPGAGSAIAHRSLEWGRTIMAAGCLGTARGALALTVEHASARVQFGKSLLALGGVRADVARMAARVHAMAALVERTAALDAGRQDLGIASLVTKVFASEAAFEVCDRALQLHGALGFMEDTGVARMLRDCRVTRIFEGANEVLVLRLGAALASGAADVSFAGAAPTDSPGAREWARVAARLAEQAGELRRREGVAIVKFPAILSRLGRAAVRVAAASAALGRSGRGSVVAEYAATLLAREACAELDAIPFADADTHIEDDVVEELLGRARVCRRSDPARAEVPA